MPAGVSLERLKDAYGVARYKLKVRALKKDDGRDWEMVQRIIRATALLAYSCNARRNRRFLTPDQEMKRPNDLANEFRLLANPGRADAIRAKLKEACFGNLEL